MITIYIEPGTIAPFVDNKDSDELGQLINFKVKSRYYVPVDNLSITDIFNNEYYDIYETASVKNQKPLQITTRTSQIDSKTVDTYTYGFSISLSPEINEITQPNLNYFSNFREQENFNSYINRCKEEIIFEWEERKFLDEDETFQLNDITILNSDFKWSTQYKNNYQLIHKLFKQERIKRSSIKNLKNPGLRGLAEDFKIQFPINNSTGPFNDELNGYCEPVIYNNQLQKWENTSTLKLLNNYWEKILLNLTDQEKYSFIAKLLYPIRTNSDIQNFKFGGYLEPFPLRDLIQLRMKPKHFLTGINFSLIEGGINTKGLTNFIKDYVEINPTTTQLELNNLNTFFEGSESFSEINDIAMQEYTYIQILRNTTTQSIFDLNGNITNQKTTIVTQLDAPYPIFSEGINLAYVNADESKDVIKPFNDNNIVDNYRARYDETASNTFMIMPFNNFEIATPNFYGDIEYFQTYPEKLNQLLQILADLAYNKTGVLNDEIEIQYSPNGYDIDKLTSPIGRDSKIYVGMKE